MAKLEQEYAGRKVAFTLFHESVNKDVEDILIDEFPDEYITNGVRNWLKIQRDIAYIKRAVKSRAPPKREVVRSLLTKRNEDEFERSIGMPQLSANDQSKFQTNYATVTPMRKKLQSYDVNFPTKKSSGEKIANETLFPSTPEEEMEQLSMATKLSSMAFEDVPSVTDDTATDAASSTGVTGNSPPVQTRV